MANISEEANYAPTIYEIATTDPVGGGTNAVVNVQARQLANRTKWLKAIADEVVAARGNYANLLARLEALIPLDVESQNALSGAIMEAIGQAGLANREMLKDRKIRRQQGVITLSNKGIISGCGVVKSTSASRNLSADPGVIFAKGQMFPFNGEENGAAVPSNNSAASMTCYAYLRFLSDGKIDFAVTELGGQVPQGGIPLYLVTVPSGNDGTSDPGLASVTLTSVRRIESNFPIYFSTALYANVSLPFPMTNTNYAISVDVISMEGSDLQRGQVYPGDRNVNGFKIYYNGIGDNLQIRWHISNPNL
jgi:hypothetical protein